MNSSADHETAFQMSASNIRFGAGVTREVGMDLIDLGVSRTLVVFDPALVSLPVGRNVIESLERADIDFTTFDEISIEPTDRSFQAAAQFAREGRFDSFVAVGGGSTIDTAKAANLYSTYPADFLDYVNAPIGKGLPVPGPLKPLIAIPTTAGTGSETTGVAIFDYVEKRAKTGIAHRYLKPTLGIVDPDNTRTLPKAVAASSGLDVLSHALESYTAVPFHRRPRPGRPLERPAYQGANPISDIWSLRALEIVAEFLLRAVADPTDDEARGQMLLAAAMAGIGFGNAGVHLPHGMSYPVAGNAGFCLRPQDSRAVPRQHVGSRLRAKPPMADGMVRGFQPDGYAVDHPLIPHGISVILHTPAVVRFTAQADPGRHLEAARALGADVANVDPDDAGEILADCVIRFMRKLNMPNGLKAVGYTEADIPALVEGTLPQHRVTKLSPRPAGAAELTSLFEASLEIW